MDLDPDYPEFIRNMSQTDPHFCTRHGTDIVTHWFNRALKCIGALLCGIAVPLLIHVQHKYILHSTFHFNIKAILIWYFATATAQAMMIVFYVSYQFQLSFVANPCDVFLSERFYMTGQYLNDYLLMVQVHLQAVACIERTIARRRVHSYESCTKTLGILLCGFALFFPLPICIYALYDYEYAPQLSVLSAPVTPKVHALFVLGIVVCILCIVSVHLMCMRSRRNRISASVNISCKFQMLENACTSLFISTILYLQLLIYIICGVATLLLRFIEPMFGDDYQVVFKTLKSSVYLIPVFLLLLPLTTRYVLERDNMARKRKSSKIVNMSAFGEEGRKNYESVLHKMWS